MERILANNTEQLSFFFRYYWQDFRAFHLFRIYTWSTQISFFGGDFGGKMIFSFSYLFCKRLMEVNGISMATIEVFTCSCIFFPACSPVVCTHHAV